MREDSLTRIAMFTTDLDKVVSECIFLREENKRLRKIEKEYREFLANNVANCNKQIGLTLKALLEK